MAEIPEMIPCSVVLDPEEVSRYFKAHKKRKTSAVRAKGAKNPRITSAAVIRKNLKNPYKSLVATTSTNQPKVQRVYCAVCHMSCPSYEQLYNHYSKIHDIEAECKQCKRFNINLDYFYSHLLNLHSDLSPHGTIDQLINNCLSANVIRYTAPVVTYKCLFCSEKLDSVDLLYKHIDNFHFYCQICSHSYENIDEFDEHKMEHHSNNFTTQECLICKLVGFQSLFLLFEHFRIKHALKNVLWICTGSNFLPLDGKYINCCYCSMIFEKSDAQIKNHLLEHELNRCISCKKGFITNQLISSDVASCYCFKCRIQIRKIYFEKIKCSVCNKQFLNKMAFHEHELQCHNIVSVAMQISELPINSTLPCLFCNLLLQPDKIEKHVTTAHPISCTYCSIDFKTASQLKYHQFVQHTQDYECNLCSKLFENPKKYIFHHKLFHESAIAVCNTFLKREMSKVNADNDIVSKYGSSFCPYCDKLVEYNIIEHIEFTHHVIRCASCERFTKVDPVNDDSSCSVCKLDNVEEKFKPSVGNETDFEFVDFKEPNIVIKTEPDDEDEFLNANVTFIDDTDDQSIKIEPAFEDNEILKSYANHETNFSDTPPHSTNQQTSTITSKQLTTNDGPSTENNLDMFILRIPKKKATAPQTIPMESLSLKDNITLEVLQLHCNKDPPQISWKVTFKDPYVVNSNKMQRYKSVTYFKCSICKKRRFQSLDGFNSHNRECHKEELLLSNQKETKNDSKHKEKMYVVPLSMVEYHEYQCYINILQSEPPQKNLLPLISTDYTCKIKQLSCLLCSKLFDNLKTISLHLIYEHIYCKVCETAFKSTTELSNHFEEHERGNIILYKCEYCLYFQVSTSSMEEHLLDTHCKKMETSNTIIYKHLSMARGVLECAYCILNFRDEDALIQHMKYFHEVRILN